MEGKCLSSKDKMDWDAWYNSLTPREQVNHLFHMVEHRQKKIVDTNMQRADISAPQHRILGMLNHQKEMSQKEIAELMGVSTATIAVNLKKMEAAGLIEKAVNERDNRFNRIRSTDKGREVLEYGFCIMGEIDKRAVECFTEEEIDTLKLLLTKYRDNLKALDGVDFAREVKKEE